ARGCSTPPVFPLPGTVAEAILLCAEFASSVTGLRSVEELLAERLQMTQCCAPVSISFPAQHLFVELNLCLEVSFPSVIALVDLIVCFLCGIALLRFGMPLCFFKEIVQSDRSIESLQHAELSLVRLVDK